MKKKLDGHLLACIANDSKTLEEAAAKTGEAANSIQRKINEAGYEKKYVLTGPEKLKKEWEKSCQKNK